MSARECSSNGPDPPYRKAATDIQKWRSSVSVLHTSTIEEDYVLLVR